mmetsp:Transcript_63223/g.186897  ORF Transcript_63223/g.186897 Transcript_63223/m.186897 type:complete len:238 (+) Transcript_63223:611-1324(+)
MRKLWKGKWNEEVSVAFVDRGVCSPRCGADRSPISGGRRRTTGKGHLRCPPWTTPRRNARSHARMTKGMISRNAPPARTAAARRAIRYCAGCSAGRRHGNIGARGRSPSTRNLSSSNAKIKIKSNSRSRRRLRPMQDRFCWTRKIGATTPPRQSDPRECIQRRPTSPGILTGAGAYPACEGSPSRRAPSPRTTRISPTVVPVGRSPKAPRGPRVSRIICPRRPRKGATAPAGGGPYR